MRTFTLADHPSFVTNAPAHFPEHSAFTGSVSQLKLPDHRCNFGVIYPLSGSLTFSLNGVTKILDENSFLIVNRNSQFSLSVRNGPTRPFLLYFQSRTRVPNDAEPDWGPTERIYPATESFKNRIRALAALPGSCSSFLTMKGDAIVRSILVDIIHYNQHSSAESLQLDVRKKSTRHENYKKLVSARDWIEENFHQPLSLETLSEIAAMNHQHFLRLFRQVFHKTPHQYIIDRRIAEAKQLLTNRTIPVSDVCMTVGWDSLGTFSQLFKQKTGQSPAEFRKQSGGDHVS